MNILDYKLIELDKILHHVPKKINGKYIGKVLYNDDEIKIKTSYLRCIGPIILNENRCYLELELDVDDKDLYEFFADLDDINMTVAYQNSEMWFEEQFPMDIIDEYYKRFIRYNSRLKKPYIKIKIPYEKKNGILLDNFDENDFKLGTLISATLKLDGLRFFKQQFTIEWSLLDYDVENNYEFKENLYNIENNIYKDISDNIEKTEPNEENILLERTDKEGESQEREMHEEKENCEEIISDEIREEDGRQERDKNGTSEEIANIIESSDEMIDNIKKVYKKSDGVVKEKKRRKSRPRIIKYAHRNRIWN